MQGDLISRSELLRKWNESSVRGRTEFDQIIMCEPVAYDLRKVINQIERCRYISDKDGNVYGEKDFVRIIQAINIVRNGGT